MFLKYIKLSIANKLMLAMLGLTVLILISTLTMARWSFETGFKDYINAVEMKRLALISRKISRVYVAHGKKWKKIKPDLMRHHLEYSTPGQLSRITRRVTRKAPQLPRKKKPEKIIRASSRFLLGKVKTNNGSNRKLPSGVGKTTAIFKTNGKRIAGRHLDFNDDSLLSQEVMLDGKVIAIIKSSPDRKLNKTINSEYSKNQLLVSGLIGLVILLIASVVAWILVKLLLTPVRQIISGVNRLSVGDYSHRFNQKPHDELGKLMDDLNRLSYKLEQAKSKRQQWLADVSHELRTPLTVLTADVALIKDGIRPFSEEQLESLDSEIERLRHMTDDLYQLSISEIGGLQYQFTEVSLEKCVLHAKRAYQTTAQKKGIEVVVNIEKDFLISADEKRMKQLLANLMSNSLAYTHRPGKVIISLTQEENGVLLAVDDTHPGVPEEACENLFDPLYRLDESRKRRESGSGLGLAICRNIVKAHRGTITASPSNLGGLRVIVRLPLQG